MCVFRGGIEKGLVEAETPLKSPFLHISGPGVRGHYFARPSARFELEHVDERERFWITFTIVLFESVAFFRRPVIHMIHVYVYRWLAVQYVIRLLLA